MQKEEMHPSCVLLQAARFLAMLDTNMRAVCKAATQIQQQRLRFLKRCCSTNSLSKRNVLTVTVVPFSNAEGNAGIMIGLNNLRRDLYGEVAMATEKMHLVLKSV